MSRERYTKPFVLTLVLLLLARLSQGSFENVTGRAFGPGNYKYLIFPQGSNVQLVYCLTVATLAKPQGFFTFGVTAGLAYELPYQRTIPLRRSAELYHRRSRRDLYRDLEVMLKTQGLNGRDCVLKALCHSGKSNRRPRSSFLREILHSIFTFPPALLEQDEADEEKLTSSAYEWAYNAPPDCDQLFPACPHNLLDAALNILE